ncbi:MAG: hypothetical protein AAGA38_04120 [Pseudomonadota bacterium]
MWDWIIDGVIGEYFATAVMMTLDPIRDDMQRFSIALSETETLALRNCAVEVAHNAGSVILTQTSVADRIIFLTEGIAASEQTWIDGNTTIARFFEPPDLCTNVTSAWTGQIASDELLAVTDVKGLSIPLSFFMKEYLSGGAFGIYLRHRMMEAHLFAKELVCAKTSGNTETRQRFLETHHQNVLDLVPQKDIAKFLGIMPQSLSRFLRNKSLSD